MFVVEAARDLAGDGAFAGAGRAINGDNQTTRGHDGEYISPVLRFWVVLGSVVRGSHRNELEPDGTENLST